MTLSVGIVILSYNRRDALLATLAHVLREPRAGSIVVVDNASSDGSVDAVRRAFPSVQVVALSTNVGVEGFNVGVRVLTTDLVLILDDDAWPEPGALDAAAALLDAREDIGGVALSPHHPRLHACEWPFATRATYDFPVMGCGNLVRTRLWTELGGYEKRFFLYRNDVDLALRLLARGCGVAFDPAWRVMHDSPAAAVKSERWLTLATRNWCWMAKRHGGWLHATLGIVLGSVWALHQAGLRPSRLRATVAGVLVGLLRPAPAVHGTNPALARRAYASFLGLMLRGRMTRIVRARA